MDVKDTENGHHELNTQELDTHKSRNESPGIGRQILNMFGFGTQKNRTEYSINREPHQNVHQMNGEILFLGSENSINRNPEKIEENSILHTTRWFRGRTQR